MSKNTNAEYNRAKLILKPLFMPFNRLVTFIGKENRIDSGPNLITANHPGFGRDIAGIVIGFDRQLHVMAAHYLFDRKVFIKDHIEPALGPILYKLLYPIARSFAGYFTSKMNRLEMIPINKDYHGDKKELSENLRKAIAIVKDYLLRGKAVVMFQIPLDMLKTMGRKTASFKIKSAYNDYLPKFNPTVGKIIYELYQDHDLIVPVTPIGVYGAEGINPFKRMTLNIGSAMDIKASLENQTGKSPVTDFTNRLEKRVAELLEESLAAQNR
jgi:1-acyl-sn-glycerol-3-phosphate acyltransferase